MKTSTMLKHVANYGLVAGLMLIAYSLFTYLIGQSLNKTLGYLSLVILAICLYIFSKQYRDKVNGGVLTYGQGFSVGLLVGIFAGILVTFFSVIELTYIDPSLIDKQLDMIEQQLLAKGMSEDQVEMAISMSKKWMTPGLMFIGGILSFAFWSALISLITAAVLRKNPSPFNENNSNE